MAGGKGDPCYASGGPWRISEGAPWRMPEGASAASAASSSRHASRGAASGQRRMEKRRQMATEGRARASWEELRLKAEEHAQDLARMQLNTVISESFASTERAKAEDAWEEVTMKRRMVESLQMEELFHQGELEEAEHYYNQEEATAQKLLMQLDEIRATKRKFEAMSSKAQREARDLRNQIQLEQATLEVKREMTVVNLVDSVDAATMPAAVKTSEIQNQVVQIEEANPDIVDQEVHTPELEDDEDDAPASDPLFRAIESAKGDSRAWMNDGLS